MVQNLILIGFMGTGKTSVARCCAPRLNWLFVDIDQEIEAKLQCSIADVFSSHGEQFFRQVELEVLRAVLQRNQQVVATGGGVVTQPAARSLLEHSRNTGSRIIWLQARPEVILKRVGRSRKRPLLNHSNPLLVINELLAKRQRWYQQVADVVIDTSDLTIDEVVQTVLSYLEMGES